MRPLRKAHILHCGMLACALAFLAACTAQTASEAPAGVAAPPPAVDAGAPKDVSEVMDPRPAEDPAIALPDDYEIVSNVLGPAESYLPRADGMPTGVVLLDPRERQSNRRLCDALLGERTATVRTHEDALRDDPRGDYLVTHWMVTQAVANEGDCAGLIAAYDFDRAGRIKGAYSLQAMRGPVFLALDASGEIVFLDLSDASPDEVFKATSDWMELALAAPQSGPDAGKPPASLLGSANRLFGRLAGGLASLVGANPGPPTVVRFNDPIAGRERQFNLYRAGVYLIGATFVL